MQSFHQRQVMPTSSTYQPLEGWCREMLNRGRDSCGRYFGQRSGTILERQVIEHSSAEIVSIERFWRWALEERRGQQSRDVRCGGVSGTGECTSDIGYVTSVSPHPIVDQSVAGSGIESQYLRSLPDPSDIG